VEESLNKLRLDQEGKQEKISAESPLDKEVLPDTTGINKRLKLFAESLGLNPDEVLSRDALAMPHRTVVDPEQRKIEVLNQALKQAILQELRQ